MTNEQLYKFLDYDNEVKDERWCEEMVRTIITGSNELISLSEWERGEKVLAGTFPDVDLNTIFSSKDMIRHRNKLSKTSIHLFENVRNSLIDDRINANLKCYVNSLDPEKEEKKKTDKELLKNRKGIESLMDDITANNGMPPQKIAGDDFHGNVDEFDDAGLNELDSDNLETFFEHKWGLRQEKELQKPLNAVMRANQFTRNYDKYINSILISRYVCSQVYVDDITGKISTRILYPHQIKVLHATGSNDFKDAQAFYVTEKTNVRGFLRQFGTSFNMETDWNILVGQSTGSNGVGYLIGNGYTGFSENGNLMCGTTGNTIDFKKVLDMPIEYGYVEFKTICQIKKQMVVTPEGNLMKINVNSTTPAVDGLPLEQKMYEETYRAYFLAQAGTMPNKIIKWGKVYMQNINGVNDEYSGFTIKVNKRDGVPMSEIIRPFWHLMNVCFKMFEMMVNDIKPDGWFFNYTSLMQIVTYLQKSKDGPDDVRSGIDNYFKMVDEGINALSDNPQTEEGAPMGGGNMAVMPKKNGINAAANELIKLMEWVEVQVKKYTATDGMEPADPRDGYKLSIENRKRTRLQTAFIDTILLEHIEDISITVLNYVQDISKFKDLPAYKCLEDLVGYKCMEFIATMKKSPHKYGTFIDTFNNDIEMMEVKQMITQDFQQNKIPLEEAMMLRSFDNLKDAIYYLAVQRRKQEKKRQQEQMGLITAQQKADADKLKGEMDLENVKGQWREKSASAQALGFANAAATNSKAGIYREQIKQEGQNERLSNEAINEIDKMNAEYNKQQQQPAATL